MTYHVVIEPTAERGIREAVRWITRQSSSHAVATRWFHGLVRKFDTLKSSPKRCPIAAENDKFPEEIRELLYGKRNNKYRIIFTIRGNAVHVLHVHHGARDEPEP